MGKSKKKKVVGSTTQPHFQNSQAGISLQLQSEIRTSKFPDIDDISQNQYQDQQEQNKIIQEPPKPNYENQFTFKDSISKKSIFDQVYIKKKDKDYQTKKKTKYIKKKNKKLKKKKDGNQSNQLKKIYSRLYKVFNHFKNAKELDRKMRDFSNFIKSNQKKKATRVYIIQIFNRIERYFSDQKIIIYQLFKQELQIINESNLSKRCLYAFQCFFQGKVLQAIKTMYIATQTPKQVIKTIENHRKRLGLSKIK